MLAVERRQGIIEIIQSEKKVLVSELSEAFQVTEETIRRDLAKLEEQGVLSRTYGGAILSEKIKEDLPYAAREDLNIGFKQEIAKKVRDYVSDCDSLFFDASSTGFEVAQLLKNSYNGTVITNSVKILGELSNSNASVVSTGGMLRPFSFSLVGSIAHETIKRYNVDAAILSCRSLHLNRGAMDSNQPDSEIKKLMVSHANKTFILVDHTKFNTVAFVNFLPFSEMDYLVTDQKPKEEWIRALRNLNVELIY